MERPSTFRSRLATLALTLACGALLPAWRCTSMKPKVPPRSYTVRAQILRMPGAARRNAEMVVRHEAIDDFVDDFGFPVGMDAMEMSFPVEPPLSAQGLAVGDKIAFRFLMDWEASTVKVDRLEKLPADTALYFGPARRGQDSADAR